MTCFWTIWISNKFTIQIPTVFSSGNMIFQTEFLLNVILWNNNPHQLFNALLSYLQTLQNTFYLSTNCEYETAHKSPYQTKDYNLTSYHYLIDLYISHADFRFNFLFHHKDEVNITQNVNLIKIFIGSNRSTPVLSCMLFAGFSGLKYTFNLLAKIITPYLAISGWVDYERGQ